ncbi:hypothetical protein [Flexithrix dorotheae]|uniref:hypothetical protein n=1 Tax=Flexithrix dorotheae TaxID=70993 RepID=UPI00039FD730|nr:hypothetical protein [Flexithrix dorotheae]
MSSYLQDIVVYLGSNYVFEEASGVLNKLLFLDISAKQIENVSEKIGQILQEEEQEKIDHQEALPSDLIDSQEVLTYVEMDGSMVFTREEKWKEWSVTR